MSHNRTGHVPLTGSSRSLIWTNITEGRAPRDPNGEGAATHRGPLSRALESIRSALQAHPLNGEEPARIFDDERVVAVGYRPVVALPNDADTLSSRCVGAGENRLGEQA